MHVHIYLIRDDVAAWSFAAKILGHDESPPPYAAHKARRGKKSNRINSSGMNFANASSGAVYLVPTLGAQIDQFSSLVSDGVITERDLDESVALVAYSGRDYGRISNSASDDYVSSTHARVYMLLIDD